MAWREEIEKNGGYQPICGKCSTALVRDTNICPVTGDVEEEWEEDDFADSDRVAVVALECPSCGFRWVIAEF